MKKLLLLASSVLLFSCSTNEEIEITKHLHFLKQKFKLLKRVPKKDHLVIRLLLSVVRPAILILST